jgi:hypothetical protein
MLRTRSSKEAIAALRTIRVAAAMMLQFIGVRPKRRRRSVERRGAR